MVPVKLHLKNKVNEDYLRWVFNSRKGHIPIRSKQDIGKFIISKVCTSTTPQISHGENHITILLPLNHFKESKTFLYFDDFATEQINKAINFYFNSDFRQFCLSGAEKGIQKHIIITAFIRLHNLTNTKDLYERLKKKDYRRRKMVDEFLVKGVKYIDNEYNSIDYQD